MLVVGVVGVFGVYDDLVEGGVCKGFKGYLGVLVCGEVIIGVVKVFGLVVVFLIL